MILSSADILRILGGSEIVRLSAKLKIVDGKRLHLGSFGTIEEAAKAYNDALLHHSRLRG